jgi:hypothetical protein
MDITQYVKYLFGFLCVLLILGCCNCRDVAPKEVRFNAARLDLIKTEQKLNHFRINLFDSSVFNYTAAGIFLPCNCTSYIPLNKLTSLKIYSTDTKDNVLNDISDRFVGSYVFISNEKPQLFNSIPSLIEQFPDVLKDPYIFLVDKEEGNHKGEYIKAIVKFNDGDELITNSMQL